jgi:hypothetical protein
MCKNININTVITAYDFFLTVTTSIAWTDSYKDRLFPMHSDIELRKFRPQKIQASPPLNLSTLMSVISALRQTNKAPNPIMIQPQKRLYVSPDIRIIPGTIRRREYMARINRFLVDLHGAAIRVPLQSSASKLFSEWRKMGKEERNLRTKVVCSID